RRLPEHRVRAALEHAEVAARRDLRQSIGVAAEIRVAPVEREDRARDAPEIVVAERARIGEVLRERRGVDEIGGGLREARRLPLAVSTEPARERRGDLRVARFALEAERRDHLVGPSGGAEVRVDQRDAARALRMLRREAEREEAAEAVAD